MESLFSTNIPVRRLNPITIPSEYDYLDQYMEQLPVNCLLHKGKTGCGGTEMVLKSKKNLIIAVPTKDLIINKIEPNEYREERRDWILGVMGGILKQDIEEYIKGHEVKKIMVTYDSLPKLTRIIKSMGVDVYNDYFLLVDEYHRLFLDNFFRDKAVKGILEEAPLFKEVTFMTATPVDDDFIMEELRRFPVQEIYWEKKTEVKLIVLEAYSVMNIVRYYICWFKKETSDISRMNFHFFVNSVTFISSVCKKSCLTPENTRIICSDTSENKKKLPDGFQIESTNSPVKKFNFYTSTVFEGSDIRDKKGIIIIVSDGHVDGRIVDISTSMVQIIGRIRDSENLDNVFYFRSKQDMPLLYSCFLNLH